MGSTAAPERILKQMADLWLTLAQPEGEAGAGVLRACSMTLVVAAEESDDPQGIGETLAALMPEHPSRAVVIRLRPGTERALAARVFAQCWMPFGERRQICCEQIEISGTEAGLADLPGVLEPLAAPDLPVMLWCRSARLFLHADFARLARIARKVIVDSAAFADARAIVPRLASTPGAIGDLAWTRLTRWRELIANAFAAREYLKRLPEITEAVVEHFGETAPVSARYMQVWLSDGLERAGSRAQVRLERAVGAAPRPLRSVELRAGAEGLLSLTLRESDCAELRVGPVVSRAAFPAPTDYQLMREELSIPGRDPVYERVLGKLAANGR